MINQVTVNYNPDVKNDRFLDAARITLSPKDFSLLSEVLSDWRSASSLAELFSIWDLYKRLASLSSLNTLHTLCFNVRGFDIRWGEVSLLAAAHNFDVMILGEVGRFNPSLAGSAFANYRYFYQPGENAHGGILVFVRMDIVVSRVKCSIPNVCAVDIHLEQPIRIIAIYAPESKSWKWDELSCLTTSKCIVMGDFNVDLEKDGDKAELLLQWMDGLNLIPTVPDTNTSLRSDRTIDYALSVGVDIAVQAYEGDTTSDHKPLICNLACDGKENLLGCKTNWSIFSLTLIYLRILGEAMEL
jgi:hypothetical protein